MSTLINLVISFIIGLFFGHTLENQQTTQKDPHKVPIEIMQQLKTCQHILDS